MIVPKLIQDYYSQQESYVKILKRKVEETLLPYCSSLGYAFLGRIKTVQSLSEKIETGRFSSWSEIDDLYAATIVVPNKGKEKGVIEHIGTLFDIIKSKRRETTENDPDVFRFDHTRMYCQMKDMSISHQVKSIVFEIQVKTVFEYAWGVSTHDLFYKADIIDWRLSRLAAQLKASVEQLDMIVADSSNAYLHVVPSPSKKTDLRRLTLELITDFFNNPEVPEEICPKDKSRLSDNICSLIKKVDIDKIKHLFSFANVKANILKRANFPRSISAFQFFIGVAIENGIQLNENKALLITFELETIFPASKRISHRFMPPKVEFEKKVFGSPKKQLTPLQRLKKSQRKRKTRK